MELWRKKPLVVEAFQWFPEMGAVWPVRLDPYREAKRDGTKWFAVDTREGPLTVSPGDWIVKGVEDEFYPIKPTIFAKTYERVI